MQIISINIKNSRCFENLSYLPRQGLNTLVGENSAGKSTLFLAVNKLLASTQEPGYQSFSSDDLRYGGIGAEGFTVECRIELNDREQRNLLATLLSGQFSVEEVEYLYRCMTDILPTVDVVFNQTRANRETYIKLGPIYIQNNWLSNALRVGGTSGNPADMFRTIVADQKDLKTVLDSRNIWNANGILKQVGQILLQGIKCFAEFRDRPSPTSRTGVLESLAGGDTASVLLNLKIHPELNQRQRYQSICTTFSNFYPNLRVEAVETEPGTGAATVQFIEKGSEYPIPLENVGAGVAEVLTLITNLVARENCVFIIEEPEAHLHAHSKRRLQKLIAQASDKNQVFVITHDTHFITPDYLRGMVRLAYSTQSGSKLHPVISEENPTLHARLKTSLRNLTNREVLFSRAVLLVEDESHQGFIIGCSSKMSIDLDAHGVSILPVDGDGNFKHLIPFVKALGIPFICLKDKPWHSSLKYPPDTYRSLGCELEEFGKKEGLGYLWDEAKKKVGSGSKQRLAKWVGEALPSRKVPKLIQDLIRDVVKLASQNTETC
jgi:energy-coupling factor transporter ATP-binding protein EcfA2